jgi:hypothetical protein
MQHSEKRLVPRIPLGSVKQGALSLLVQGQRIGIDRLRDISGSGLSFFIHQPLQVSDSIAVEYADGKVKLEVFGRVAWCSQTHTTEPLKAPSGSYLVGIELLSPMMLFAVLPKA